MKKSGQLLLAAVLAAGGMLFCSVTAYAGSWNQGDQGWWYVNDDRSYPIDTWQEINGRWYHFDWNGYMEKGWLEFRGVRYYLDQEGAMVSGRRQIIDNGVYQFNGTGTAAFVREHSPEMGFGDWEGYTFKNHWSDYRITLPVNSSSDEISRSDWREDFSISYRSGGDDSVSISIVYFSEEELGGQTDAQQQVLLMRQEDKDNEHENYVSDIAAVNLGDMNIISMPCH